MKVSIFLIKNGQIKNGNGKSRKYYKGKISFEGARWIGSNANLGIIGFTTTPPHIAEKRYRQQEEQNVAQGGVMGGAGGAVNDGAYAA